MTPMEAVKCAKIAYMEDGQAEAARLGYSHFPLKSQTVSCWIGHKGQKTVVAIRGTVLFGDEDRNYGPSLLTNQVRWIGPGLVHEGYYRAFWHIIGDLKRLVETREEVYFTGHSMGGAIALLAGALLGCQRVFCFASPRVGDREFADVVNNTRRVTRYENRCDLVTKLPFKGKVEGSHKKQTGRYVHVGRAVRLSAFGHSMDAYLNGVKAKVRGR